MHELFQTRIRFCSVNRHAKRDAGSGCWICRDDSNDGNDGSVQVLFATRAGTTDAAAGNCRSVVEKAAEAPAVDERERTLLTSIAHLAFGTVAGAIYGAAVGSKRSTMLMGIEYGLAVWALAYGVGLPSLGLHPAATDDTKDRNEVLIASHVVWGAALGRLTATR